MYNEMQTLMRTHGFTRKVAVLIIRVQRGLDTVEDLARWGILTQGEFINVSQYTRYTP